MEFPDVGCLLLHPQTATQDGETLTDIAEYLEGATVPIRPMEETMAKLKGENVENLVFHAYEALRLGDQAFYLNPTLPLLPHCCATPEEAIACVTIGLPVLLWDPETTAVLRSTRQPTANQTPDWNKQYIRGTVGGFLEGMGNFAVHNRTSAISTILVTLNFSPYMTILETYCR